MLKLCSRRASAFAFLISPKPISFFVASYRPQTKLREGYVFTAVYDSVHKGGGIPAYLAVISQHALQVSRPTPRGEVEGDLARGGLQAHNQGVS